LSPLTNDIDASRWTRLSLLNREGAGLVANSLRG
jgi:hypothetical protein